MPLPKGFILITKKGPPVLLKLEKEPPRSCSEEDSAERKRTKIKLVSF